MDQPPSSFRRPSLRLAGYDYRQPGYYFVTICTAVRNQNVLCQIHAVGGAALGAPMVVLTSEGMVVEQLLRNIDHVYHGSVRLDCYVIMPDHLHFIVELCAPESGSPRAATPTSLRNIVNTLKGLATKRIGRPIWQRDYFDHIIRTEADLTETRRYIENNPLRWSLEKD